MNSNFLWRDKKVLVLGGTGFLGMHLVKWLVDQKARVTVSDFRKPSKLALVSPGEIDFRLADVRNLYDLSPITKNQDVVFHLAAIPSIARATEETYESINVQGTHNVLRACQDQQVLKIVYVSSSTVYGIPKQFPCRETDPVFPLGKYGRSKVKAEEVCHSFAKSGLDVSIIRPRVIMGPGRMGIFSILFQRIQNHKSVFLIGSGNNVFQFTDVSDMVQSCRLAAERPGSDLFNIGSDDSNTVYEVMSQLIHHAKSKSKIIALPPGPIRWSLRCLEKMSIAPLMSEQYSIADKDFKLDTNKAKRLLGWTPKATNAECLISAYKWYLENASKMTKQYRTFFSVLGKFKRSHQSGFQE